ncbi:hypothetical protein A2U01_0114052, partial [Trifolium medium]|nr:hypothetical protein [Trifolium medium]
CSDAQVSASEAKVFRVLGYVPRDVNGYPWAWIV